MKKGRRIAEKVLLVLSVAAGFFASFKIVDIMREYRIGKAVYDGLRDDFTYNSAPPPGGDGYKDKYVIDYPIDDPEDDERNDEEDEEPKKEWVQPPLSVDWIGLKQINPDIVGWIYVEALPEISFPIVQGTDDVYYVDRTYDNQVSNSGCIFLSSFCNSDFSSPQSLVYGHNMRNGTMFSKLFDHRSDGTLDENPYFWVLTPEEEFRYKIFSIVETLRSSDVFRVFKENDEQFDAYIQDMASRNTMYHGDTSVSMEDHVVSLVTCVPQTYNRTVLFGKRDVEQFYKNPVIKKHVVPETEATEETLE